MSIIQSIRDRGALISAIVIAIALLGFILMDAFSQRSNMFGGRSSTTLGVINGQKIDQLEFEKKVKAQEQAMAAQNQNLGDIGRQRIIESLWEQEVNQAILSGEFRKLGLTVSGNELTDHLYGQNGIAPPADLAQRFSNEQGQYDAAQAQAAINGMKAGSPEQRQQLEDYLAVIEFSRASEKYSALISNSIYYPKWLLEKNNTEQSGLASITFARLTYMLVPDSSVKVSDSEIEEYIKKHEDRYQQEETRSISYVQFDAAPTAADTLYNYNQLAAIKQEFATTTDHAAFVTRYGGTPYGEIYQKDLSSLGTFADSIKALSDGQVYGPYLQGTNYVLSKMVGRRSIPDSAKVRHILIKIADRQNGQLRDDSTAKRIADSIQAAVAGGADFNALVLKYSDDEGSKNNRGEYTFSPNQSLVEEFYKTTFYEPAGTKKVVKGESGDYVGYHYLEVMEQKTFGPGYNIATITRPIIASDETERNANSEANEFAAASRNLKEFEENFEKTQKAKGRQKLIASNIKPNDYYIAGLSATNARELVRKIYDADKGDVIEPELVGDKFIVAVVTDTYDEGTMSATVARPTVEPVLRNKKKAEILKKQIGTITTPEAVAAANQVQVENVDSLRFIGMTPGLGPEARVIGASFNPANKGKVIPEVLEGQSGVFVVRVNDLTATSVVAGDIEEQRRAMISQARQRSIGFTDMMGQQTPPYLATLKKVSKIKDNRSKFY